MIYKIISVMEVIVTVLVVIFCGAVVVGALMAGDIVPAVVLLGLTTLLIVVMAKT